MVAALMAVRQGRALDPSKAFSQYIATNWTIQNGLGQKTVNGIAQTEDGFLWLATEGGLVRYDGLTFVTFDERNAPGLGDRLIRSLAPTADGGLWIGTSTGLVRYRHGQFVSKRPQTGYTNDIYDLAATSDGDVWFSSDTGLRRYMEDGPGAGIYLYTTAEGLPSNGITSLAVGDDGSLWVGTRKGLVHRVNDRFVTYTFPASAGSGDITALAAGRGHCIWIGLSDGAVARWSDGKIVPVWQGRSTRGASVWSLREDRDGTLWAAFRKQGLGRLRDGQLQLLKRADGLPSNNPDWIFEDRENSIWVGWTDTGLSMFRDGRFTVFGKPEGLSSDLVSSVMMTKDGGLLVGTDDAGLDRLTPPGARLRVGGHRRDWPAVTPVSEVAGIGVLSILRQRNGTLWVGSDDGRVTRIAGGKTTTFRVPGLLTPGVRTMVEDANGEMWFGFEMPNGLARLRDGRFEFQHVPGTITEMALAPDGSLWIAAYGGGLVHYAKGATHAYTQKDGLANLSLTSVYVHPDGTVWAGTMLGGLNRLKDGKITRYSIEQGLSDSTVGEIVRDSQGYLWLSGTRGIMRVGLNELNAYAEGSIDKVSVRTFGYGDGLRAAECNMKAHPAALRDADGRLWFATMAGLAMIDPAHIALEESAPRPIIEGLFANGRELKAGSKGLRIEPGQNVLSIRFAAPSFVAPEDTQIRYRLVGFEDAWIRGDPRQRVPFANLSPGHYRFELRAANGYGRSTGETAMLSFDVLPHFYETSWFRLTISMMVLLAVWFGLRLRTRRLLCKNQELQRLILDKTAEVRLALELAEESREILRELALRDQLTGLWNRRAIFEILETQVRRCADQGRPLTIMMADIDHFKDINDTWGHQVGDEVIREVSRRLNKGVRGGDAVGRYGGEEMLILLPDVSLKHGMERAESLREAVCRVPVETEGCSIKVSCSFGLALIQPGNSLTEIVGRADAALYQAKHDGRNCVRLQLPIEVAEAS